MWFAFALLQSRKPPEPPAPAFAAGALVGAAIGLLLMTLMFCGGVYVFVKWRKPGMGKVGFGLPLMVLPFTGLIVFGLASIMKVSLPDLALLLVPGAWLAWIVLMFVAQRSIKRYAVADEAARDAQDAAAWASRKAAPDVDPDLVEPADVPDIVPMDAAAAAPKPRRAITLPAADSDQGKPSPSEQTIKRMSVEQIKQVESAPKPPRAGEVAGNPILPEGEVKIRCLACDKKMKADSSKFLKQRRCPACKAEPFRYVTAV